MATQEDQVMTDREYKTEDGGCITLSQSEALSGYDVDCWKPDGTNHWHKFFMTEEDAVCEFERWRHLEARYG